MKGHTSKKAFFQTSLIAITTVIVIASGACGVHASGEVVHGAESAPGQGAATYQNLRDEAGAHEAREDLEAALATLRKAQAVVESAGLVLYRGQIAGELRRLENQIELARSQKKGLMLISQVDRYIADGRFGKAEDLLKEAERLNQGAKDFDAMAVRIKTARSKLLSKQIESVRSEVFAKLSRGGSPQAAWAILNRKDSGGAILWGQVPLRDRERVVLGMNEMARGTPVILMGSAMQRVSDGYMIDLGMQTRAFVYTRRNLGLQPRQEAWFAATYAGPLRYTDLRGFEHTIPAVTLKALLHHNAAN